MSDIEKQRTEHIYTTLPLLSYALLYLCNNTELYPSLKKYFLSVLSSEESCSKMSSHVDDTIEQILNFQIPTDYGPWVYIASQNLRKGFEYDTPHHLIHYFLGTSKDDIAKKFGAILTTDSSVPTNIEIFTQNCLDYLNSFPDKLDQNAALIQLVQATLALRKWEYAGILQTFIDIEDINTWSVWTRSWISILAYSNLGEETIIKIQEILEQVPPDTAYVDNEQRILLSKYTTRNITFWANILPYIINEGFHSLKLTPLLEKAYCRRIETYHNNALQNEGGIFYSLEKIARILITNYQKLHFSDTEIVEKMLNIPEFLLQGAAMHGFEAEDSIQIKPIDEARTAVLCALVKDKTIDISSSIPLIEKIITIFIYQNHGNRFYNAASSILLFKAIQSSANPYIANWWKAFIASIDYTKIRSTWCRVFIYKQLSPNHALTPTQLEKYRMGIDVESDKQADIILQILLSEHMPELIHSLDSKLNKHPNMNIYFPAIALLGEYNLLYSLLRNTKHSEIRLKILLLGVFGHIPYTEFNINFKERSNGLPLHVRLTIVKIFCGLEYDRTISQYLRNIEPLIIELYNTGYTKQALTLIKLQFSGFANPEHWVQENLGVPYVLLQALSEKQIDSETVAIPQNSKKDTDIQIPDSPHAEIHLRPILMQKIKQGNLQEAKHLVDRLMSIHSRNVNTQRYTLALLKRLLRINSEPAQVLKLVQKSFTHMQISDYFITFPSLIKYIPLGYQQLVALCISLEKKGTLNHTFIANNSELISACVRYNVTELYSVSFVCTSSLKPEEVCKRLHDVKSVLYSEHKQSFEEYIQETFPDQETKWHESMFMESVITTMGGKYIKRNILVEMIQKLSRYESELQTHTPQIRFSNNGCFMASEMATTEKIFTPHESYDFAWLKKVLQIGNQALARNVTDIDIYKTYKELQNTKKFNISAIVTLITPLLGENTIRADFQKMCSDIQGYIQIIQDTKLDPTQQEHINFNSALEYLNNLFKLKIPDFYESKLTDLSDRIKVRDQVVDWCKLAQNYMSFSIKRITSTQSKKVEITSTEQTVRISCAKNVQSFFSKTALDLCTSNDVDSYIGLENHCHMNIFDSEYNLLGMAMLYETDIHNKKYLFVRAINPTDECLKQTTAQNFVATVFTAVDNIAQSQYFDGVGLTDHLDSWHADSNKHQVYSLLRSKIYPKLTKINHEIKITEDTTVEKVFIAPNSLSAILP